jgi:predicted RecB family nuclease
MQITSDIFEAYLKCPTKCWLKSLGEKETGNIYAEWVQTHIETYRKEGIEQLLNGCAIKDVASSQVGTQNVKTAKWKLAPDFPAKKEKIESTIHLVERIPSEGRGRPAQFSPVRYIFRNKLTKDDKLLVAYDAHVLSEMLGRDIAHGKIIHGDNYTTQKVRTSQLVANARKLTSKITTLLTNDPPPDLILNRHCAECEFQLQCRQKAIEKDDLSQLAGMTEKERKKLNSKGIFTVTQLSYTFMPRRRPKRMCDKREKYHHSLKALAIREKKIHIVGNPELKIEGTPVFLDVEGLPDRDFYYLIGVRIRNGESFEQYSFWADWPEDEMRIWKDFLSILSSVENPVLIYYGSYESSFIRTMCNRYGLPSVVSGAVRALSSTINLLSVIYGRVYFPIASNSLKDIAAYYGFRWSEAVTTGIQSIAWRKMWEASGMAVQKEELVDYNAEDCTALEIVMRGLLSLQNSQKEGAVSSYNNIVDISKQKREHPYGFKRNTFLIPEFDKINQAAYWDYQRERVYLKTSPVLKQSSSKASVKLKPLIPNQLINCAQATICKFCNSISIGYHSKKSKTVIDLKFTRHGIKRWVLKLMYTRYRCNSCYKTFFAESTRMSQSHFGDNLMAYYLYQCIELRTPIITIDKSMNKIYGLGIGKGVTNHIKKYAAKSYEGTFNTILTRLCNGTLLHVDETKISLRHDDGFVWVLASMEDVVYFYTEKREGDYIQSLLKDFKGVLVSDFYAAYDSINCPQQKCLIHLIRDINDALYKHPYDEGLKQVAENFTNLLRPMVETVDRFGLKHLFLKKDLHT